MDNHADDVKIKEAFEQWEKDGGSYTNVYSMFPDVPEHVVRGRVNRHRYRKEGRDPSQPSRLVNTPPELALYNAINTPLTAEEEDSIFRRAVNAYKKERRRAESMDDNSFSFPYGPVCLVFIADAHAGSHGVDYERLDSDVELVDRTPGMWLVGVGDFIDNFVIGYLMSQQMHTSITIPEQWVLVRRILKKAAPKLIASVGGNHDNWIYKLTGIDYFGEIAQQLSGTRNILTDRDELRFDVNVGEQTYPFRVRHKWSGNSMWNPNHAITKANHMDIAAKPWRVGIGAHTHPGCYVHEVKGHGGEINLAIQLGSYKTDDDYARVNGFPAPARSVAAAVIMDEKGHLFGMSDIEAAAMYMNAVYPK